MNEKNNQYYYNCNNSKNTNMSVKSNSPILSHQQNNYYYNTKINHLIFHEYLNTNQNHNSIQNSNLYNSMPIKYDILEPDLNEGRKIIPRNQDNTYYKNSISLKKSDKFKNMKIDLNETEINMKSNISTTRNKNSENSYLKYLKDGNVTTTNNNLRNKSNPFHSINQMKKKQNINNNESDKLANNDKSQNLKDYRIKSLKNIIPKSNIQNNNTFIDLMSYKNINNNYFYNIQNNFEKSDNKSIKKCLLGKNNIFLNNYPSINSLKSNEMNYKKVPLIKNEKVGNYHIKNPYSSTNKKTNINNKNNKSPQVIGKQKSKNNINKNIKSNNYDENKKRAMNVNANNEKNKLNNENRNIKRNLINNININNSFPAKSITNNINERNINKDKINNNNSQSIIEHNKEINNKHNKSKINYYYNQLNKIPNKPSNKKNTLSLNNKIRKFCDLIEQLLYTSFRNYFKIFIKKLKEFNEYNISKRALIIRRFESTNKNKNSSNHSHNNSFSQKSNTNSQTNNNKDIINKRKKSPTKFIELQDNIKSSMMNINQDNYIQMFNELFMKQRENLMVKTCRSPVIERNIKDSLDLSSNEDKIIYDKYKINSNNELIYFSQKNSYLSKDIKNNLEDNFNKIDSNNNSNNSNNRYKLSTENSNFIGNIFDDDNINFLKFNNSIDSNLRRNNSITKLIDNLNNNNTNKNMLLYSKPIMTKSINKKEGVFSNKNMNIIYLKKNERNFNNNSLNNFMSNSNKNIFSYPRSPNINNNKNEFNDKNNSENKKESKKNEIIVKNVHTKDKKLFVFIKYVKIKNFNSKSAYSDKLIYAHTDSISLMKKYNNQKKINCNENRNNRSLNRSIQEINQQETINNDSYEEDDSKIVYLINFLQNLFNDNKKTILYNFWKNLKKIKTNYILQNSMKAKYKINKNNEKQNENKNIIELPNYRNCNLIKNKLSVNIAKNKDKEENKKYNMIKYKQKIDKKITSNNNDINIIKYNKSCNNIFDKKAQKNQENSLDNKEKSIDETIKQEQLKKIKLAKLGKLFKNLEQENNIINTIKEQFLDWTNKQDENSKKDINNKDKRKYGKETYDNINIFNNELRIGIKDNDII